MTDSGQKSKPSHQSGGSAEIKMPAPCGAGASAAGPAQIMEEINASIGFDQRLYAQDIAASKAHCEMLVAKEIITAEDGRRSYPAGSGAGRDRIRVLRFQAVA